MCTQRHCVFNFVGSGVHIICEILRLVEEQIKEVGEKGSNVKVRYSSVCFSTYTDLIYKAFLLGGFGLNRYLHKKLDVAYKMMGVKVLQINNGWAKLT